MPNYQMGWQGTNQIIFNQQQLDQMVTFYLNHHGFENVVANHTYVDVNGDTDKVYSITFDFRQKEENDEQVKSEAGKAD